MCKYKLVLNVVLQVAEADSDLRSKLAEQQEDAEKRAQARWQEVQHKLAQLAELREQLREVDATIVQLSTRLRDAQVCAEELKKGRKNVLRGVAANTVDLNAQLRDVQACTDSFVPGIGWSLPEYLQVRLIF